ncbi:hypothetical protein [Gorillibacterium massiliense]|uniref:hypothetical protein n=1 Tax=Gorillibacterium massiliense TaxID=1280390 RepID=UPI0004B922F3|nr:hypothetical protein [Gorillibacterium massiliense]
MKKVLTIAAALALVTGLLAGCGAKKDNTEASTAPTTSTAPTASTAPATSKAPDAVTTASIVNDPAAFEKAISKDGTWIIAILGDMTIDHDLVLEGDFMNKAATPVSERKLAFYTQDENRKITAQFTLTAPKLTVKSPDARIQGGFFQGDVYVDAPNFYMQDGGIKGNLYFTKQEYKDSYKVKDATVSGVTEIKALQ